jgi:indole-3-acetate monooxygenase
MDGARAIDLPDVLERLQALAPLIDQHRSDFETRRCLPPAVTQAMVDADLFRLWVPRNLGGAEISPQDLVEVVEAAAALDGSFGWCPTNANAMARMVAYLPHAVAAEWVA